MYAQGNLSLAARIVTSPQTSTIFSRAVLLGTARHAIPTLTTFHSRQATYQPSMRLKRQFSSTINTNLDYFPPPPETGNIRQTQAAWGHPIYSPKEMKDVVVAHRKAQTWSDYVALGTIRLLRSSFDIVTFYRHDKPLKPGQAPPQKWAMSEPKWMTRFIFLETVAGVPGMVGGMLRHLRSLRWMKRDNGWMESLLEEAYNERMHLLTFLKMAEPGLFMRVIVLGAQAVFFGGFTLAYLISPRTCHRFVGYLEEEAVITYTRAIDEIDAGKLPTWKSMRAPDIAIAYWKMPEGHQTMRDLLLYIRADEAKHREVNHTLGNLNPKTDPNPYTSEYKDPSKPHPTKGLEFQKPEGWERKDCL
ncbi:MAG: Alternative oxidase, mitochondrial precursor [Cirrosporium novae-zelandiae]|nr:MAG: Alternative oxidase, mitochondrial precursor [Cirrosporium novae-zelandiae]